MDEVAAIAPKEHVVGIGIGGLAGGDDAGEGGEGEVGGYDTDHMAVGGMQGHTEGGNGIVVVEGGFDMVAERVDPAGLVDAARRLVPHLVEILIVGLTSGEDGVAIVDREDGELAAVLGEGVGLGAHGAAKDAAVAGDDTAGDGLEGVGGEIGFEQPRIGGGGRLHGIHIVDHTLHVGVERAGGALRRLLMDEIVGEEEEDAQGQNEDGGGGEDDAKAQLAGECITGFMHGRPPFLSHRRRR